MRVNRAWTLAARPDGRFKPSDFAWTEAPVPALQDGQLLVRQIHLSLDPTNRGWANSTATYLPPLPIGSVMRGLGLGVVQESRHPVFRPGDYVQGLLGWQLYHVSDEKDSAVSSAPQKCRLTPISACSAASVRPPTSG